MKKIFENIKWFALTIWQLPQIILGLLLLLYCDRFGGVTLIKKEDDIYYFKQNAFGGAISLGWIVLSDTEKEETLRHEEGHCIDSQRLGWFYLLVIGLPGIAFAAVYDCEKRNFGGMTYHDFFTEKRANKNAGLKVVRFGIEPCQYWLEFA